MSRTPRHNHETGYGRPMPWVDLTGGPTLSELEPTRWHPRALCRDSTTWAWFGDSRWSTRDVVQACHACPVRRTCLASSLVYAEEYGIWGGVTAAQRVPLLNALAAGACLGDVLDSAIRPRRRRVA